MSSFPFPLGKNCPALWFNNLSITLEVYRVSSSNDAVALMFFLDPLVETLGLKRCSAVFRVPRNVLIEYLR